MKTSIYLGSVLLVALAAVVALALDRDRELAIVNSAWPARVTNLANLLQIGVPIIVAVCWCLSGFRRLLAAEHYEGAAALVLASLALVRPKRDRNRFVREVMANMADRQRWWQRLDELLSVARAMLGLAVILRWARRRRA